MKKHMIAIMLSLAMASSSVGAVPALAVETTAEEAVAEQEEISDEQEEVSEVMEDSDSGLADEDVLNEENAQTEEDPEQEETEDESESDDEQEETADTAETTEMTEEDEEEAAESEDEDDTSAEITETIEPHVIEEEVVTDEDNEAVLDGGVVDSGTCGENVTWTLTGSSDDLTLTFSGSGKMDYDGYNNPWGSRSEKIKTVIVEEGITSIGDYAFYSLNKLNDVSLPDTVTSIGNYAFFSVSLKQITIPDSVTSIGERAFSYCKSLTSITIPDSVTNIGDNAFSWCESLTSITIPDGVTRIENYAFWDCSSLTSITIPDGVTSIELGAFRHCSSLTSIMIPDSVTSIGAEVFTNCPQITVSVYSGTYGEEYVKAAGVRYKIICKNHTWSKNYTIDKEPTYTEDGSKSIHCTICDAIQEGSEIPIPKKQDNLGKTTRGDLFNLADNIKITWEAVPGAKYYKVYRNGVNEPVVVTTGLVGWDKCTTPKLEPGKMYTYKIIASTTGKGDPSGDSTKSYSKSIYRLQTTAFKYIKNTAPGKVTVSYKKSDYGDSYVLLYADNEEMKNAKSKVIYGADTTSVVLGGFKKGKTYWFQIRVRKSVAGYKLPFYTTFGAKKTVTIKQ